MSCLGYFGHEELPRPSMTVQGFRRLCGHILLFPSAITGHELTNRMHIPIGISPFQMTSQAPFLLNTLLPQGCQSSFLSSPWFPAFDSSTLPSQTTTPCTFAYCSSSDDMAGNGFGVMGGFVGEGFARGGPG